MRIHARLVIAIALLGPSVGAAQEREAPHRISITAYWGPGIGYVTEGTRRLIYDTRTTVQSFRHEHTTESAVGLAARVHIWEGISAVGGWTRMGWPSYTTDWSHLDGEHFAHQDVIPFDGKVVFWKAGLAYRLPWVPLHVGAGYALVRRYTHGENLRDDHWAPALSAELEFPLFTRRLALNIGADDYILGWQAYEHRIEENVSTWFSVPVNFEVERSHVLLVRLGLSVRY